MNDPILLTPGPLTTSAETKSAMLCDWGSWDGAFNALTASVCRDLVAIVHGTAAIMSACRCRAAAPSRSRRRSARWCRSNGKVLVPDNGAYCKRIVRILGYLGREAVVLPHDEQEPADADAHRRRLGRATRRSRMSRRCTARPAPAS